MKLDEFAFVNQQLAGMLRAGLPLEGALRQLCESMERGALRAELQQLEQDLARGRPLREAMVARQLPAFYTRMVQAGAAGNDLPGMLTLLADYYQRRHSLWARLQAVLVYPVIVLLSCCVLSVFVAWLYTHLLASMEQDLIWGRLPASLPLLIWMPAMWLVAAVAGLALALGVGPLRRWLRWRLPGFREANVAQFAGVMKLLLVGGTPLPAALELAAELEEGTGAGQELRRWRERAAAGRGGSFGTLAGGSRIFPPIFIWIVDQAGENLAAGFGRAAEIYQERARHQTDMLLYAALPVAVLVLGGLIFIQTSTMVQAMKAFLDVLGGAGD